MEIIGWWYRIDNELLSWLGRAEVSFKGAIEAELENKHVQLGYVLGDSPSVAYTVYDNIDTQNNYSFILDFSQINNNNILSNIVCRNLRFRVNPIYKILWNEITISGYYCVIPFTRNQPDHSWIKEGF